MPMIGKIPIFTMRPSLMPSFGGCSRSVTAAGAASTCAIPFPRLFDLIDKAGDAEVAGVSSGDFPSVRRGLHALRHVFHDEVPLCSAARGSTSTSPHLMGPRPRRGGKTGQGRLR